MPRKGGWRREGTRGRFRYYDARGSRITDADKLARIESLVVPPAWRDVWISPRPTAKLQATGLDKAGRRQYIYHPDFRARQDQAKYERLIRFAERLPDLRLAMAEHMDHEVLDRERVCAVALRLINRAWFRVGTDRYAKQSKTFGITTLTKRHVQVRGTRVAFEFRAKHRVVVRTVLVDAELADAMKELLELPGRGRLFRYRNDDRVVGGLGPLGGKAHTGACGHELPVLAPRLGRRRRPQLRFWPWCGRERLDRIRVRAAAGSAPVPQGRTR